MKYFKQYGVGIGMVLLAFILSGCVSQGIGPDTKIGKLIVRKVIVDPILGLGVKDAETTLTKIETWTHLSPERKAEAKACPTSVVTVVNDLRSYLEVEDEEKSVEGTKLAIYFMTVKKFGPEGTPVSQLRSEFKEMIETCVMLLVNDDSLFLEFLTRLYGVK